VNDSVSDIAQAAPPRLDQAQRSRLGLSYGLGAYTIWGFLPLYFHVLASVGPWLILWHRIFWSVLFLALVITIRGEWSAIRAILGHRQKLVLLGAGGILITLNWLVFIYSVASKQVVAVSLGYFINPLLSIVLGLVFLRERLRPWQWVAVLVATAAVAHLAWRGPGFPWIAVSAAGTFGFYGLVRKKVDVNSLHGLLIETAMVLPVAVVQLSRVPAHTLPRTTLAVLSLSGVLTVVPLLMFGGALRRLRLSTVGFLQYLGPTLQLLVALVAFHEPLDSIRLISFGLCWLAIAIYIADSLVTRRSPPIADEPE
jgi:chloramphenicol-sensitive protein RarD